MPKTLNFLQSAIRYPKECSKSSKDSFEDWFVDPSFNLIVTDIERFIVTFVKNLERDPNLSVHFSTG